MLKNDELLLSLEIFIVIIILILTRMYLYLQYWVCLPIMYGVIIREQHKSISEPKRNPAWNTPRL